LSSAQSAREKEARVAIVTFTARAVVAITKKIVGKSSLASERGGGPTEQESDKKKRTSWGRIKRKDVYLVGRASV